MNEIPGLDFLRANSEIVDEVNNDQELEITTVAHYDQVMLNKMIGFGWAIRAPNVFVWHKFLEEDINIEKNWTY